MSGTNDLLVVNDHGTNGDFINPRRKLSLLVGSLHEMAVWENFEIHAAWLLLGLVGGGCVGGFADPLQSQLANFGLGLKGTQSQWSA